AAFHGTMRSPPSLRVSEAPDSGAFRGRVTGGAPDTAAFSGTVVAVNFTESGLVFVRLADVEAKDVEWLWEDRIPRGKLTLVAGMPNVNKSTWLLDVFARIRVGGQAPAEEGTMPRGAVILLTAEDDLADTV